MKDDHHLVRRASAQEITSTKSDNDRPKLAVGHESSRSAERDVAMRADNTSRHTRERTESGFAGADPRALEQTSIRLIHSSNDQHRSFGPCMREPSMRNRTAEVLTKIDGIPILVRLVVQDVPAEARSSIDVAKIQSRLASTLEAMVERMRGSPIQGDDLTSEPLATIELISSGTRAPKLPALDKPALRVGSLELDLIERTATRGARQIDLRPREFKLLKYMMQRSDNLLTRAALLKDVWHYNFVPETNLVDVHMGRLRRKVDGSNEAPMIRNVRGVGFVLSASPFPQHSPPKVAERLTPAPGQ
jgi:DNA-binding winged helix-turn-helix (wHTH) protein